MRGLLFYVLAIQCIALILGSTKDYKDNICFNGDYDTAGNCQCREGYSLFNGNCFLATSPTNYQAPLSTRTTRRCGAGMIQYNGNCAPIDCSGTSCGAACLPGFILKDGFCVLPDQKCPQGMVSHDGYCHYYPLLPSSATLPPLEKIEEVPPLRVTIPMPELPLDPLDPNNGKITDSEEVEVVPNLRPPSQALPATSNVHNLNTVNSPTDVNTHNVNNVFVHITRTKANGAIKAVVIRNNETTVYEEPPKEKSDPASCEETEEEEEEDTSEPPSEQPKKCCIVVSPRICQKQDQDEWVCFHRKHYRCGSFCTADIMYLKPRQPKIHNSMLLMPPTYGYSPMMRFGICRWGVCPPIDCSGCLSGTYRCHYKCYTYDCAQYGKCNFINQEEFCNEHDDDLC
ncbi:uncharacterized protein LOC129756446 [Uranotaenia lowii]|uniref:uncharacterized protein LOC129756446 n=1 Tax=Uranotaenia lowii TaxID=190385 RepID=UPI002478ED2B|nr:uncharacterized protein LOC129756446 [Uranotaenia lowii]